MLYALGVLVDEGGWQVSVGVIRDAVCGIYFEELGARVLLRQLVEALLQGGAFRHSAEWRGHGLLAAFILDSLPHGKPSASKHSAI